MDTQDQPQESVVNHFYAEFACIAFILAGKETCHKVLSELKPENFAGMDGKFRIIFESAKTLQDSGKQVNFISLNKAMVDSGDIERIGGSNTLMQIGRECRIKSSIAYFPNDSESVFSTLESAIKTVKDQSNERAFIAGLKKVIRRLEGADNEQKINVGSAVVLARNVIDKGESVTELKAKTGYASKQRITDFISGVGDVRSGIITTGFPGFDELGGGLGQLDVVSLVAADKMGKTQLALTIVDHIARVQGIPCAIVSTELPEDDIYKRRIAMNSNRELSYSKLRGDGSKMSKYEREVGIEVWHKIYNDPIYIIDDFDSSEEAVYELENLILTEGVQFFLFDYLQRPESSMIKNTEQAITWLSKRLSDLPRIYKSQTVCALIVSQINNQGIEETEIYGHPSGKNVYGSRQINKDCTYRTSMWTESELFQCNCSDQTESDKLTDSKANQKEIKRTRWTMRPTGGRCGVCNDYVRCINPIRSGRWFIEKARNSRANEFIPYLFDADYMMMVEDQNAKLSGSSVKSKIVRDDDFVQKNFGGLT